MFTIKNIIYSEPGKILKTPSTETYHLNKNFIKNESLLKEEEVDINDLKVKGDYILYSKGLIMRNYPYNYDEWKSHIIKWRYSMEAQIAIILNKDNSKEDTLAFQKMQEWRDWAGAFASKIIEFKSNE